MERLDLNRIYMAVDDIKNSMAVILQSYEDETKIRAHKELYDALYQIESIVSKERKRLLEDEMRIEEKPPKPCKCVLTEEEALNE